MSNHTLKKKIRSISDWPKRGVIFRDIAPVLENKKAFRLLINELAKNCQGKKIDKIVGIDARGFILAAALAYKLKTGLVIARKRGKLPHKVIQRNYDLEYASDTLEMHADAIKAGEKILLVDDVLATGSTMRAVVGMVNELGGKIVQILFFIELPLLKGRQKLKGQKVKSLILF